MAVLIPGHAVTPEGRLAVEMVKSLAVLLIVHAEPTLILTPFSVTDVGVEAVMRILPGFVVAFCLESLILEFDKFAAWAFGIKNKASAATRLIKTKPTRNLDLKFILIYHDISWGIGYRAKGMERWSSTEREVYGPAGRDLPLVDI